MRGHLHVAVPCEEGPQVAAHRHAVEPDIGDRNRLHGDRRSIDENLGGTEQSRFEWQDAIAVTARPLREQDEIAPRRKTLRDGVALPRAVPRSSLDEDGSL